jgi:hypothetical protein
VPEALDQLARGQPLAHLALGARRELLHGWRNV